MTFNNVRISAVGLALFAVFATAAPAFAQTTTAPAGSVSRLSAIITKANADITARITTLNNLNARVQAMKNESTAEKASIASQVQTNIMGLTALQSTIDADTVVTKARSDAQTIFTTYRIYALVVPQGWILASADRVTTITGLMATLGTKIQARIAADQSAGKDVSAITAAYSDMNAKIADANTQAASSQSGVTGLVPDQGNKTTAASNHTALVAARADIKTATQDIQAARADIKTILQDLKALGPVATSTTATN